MQERINTTLVDRYYIIAILGQGGMGAVYLAQDIKDQDRLVAIKVMSSPNMLYGRQRFEREARALARLNHPHIVHFYEQVSDHDPPFMVIEYIKGQDLRKMLDSTPNRVLPLDQAIQITRQIGQALHFAHQNGIYHRDVKPSNILVGIDGQAYLADLGLAKMVDRITTSSSSQQIQPDLYKAPEQVLGEKVGAYTDMYSLGACLYEMLTGQPPFNFKDINDQIKRLEENPVPPNQLNQDIPQGVSWLILKTLNRNPADRYHDMAEMLNDLDTVIQEEQIEQKIAMQPQVVMPRCLKFGRGWIAAGLLVLLMLIGLTRLFLSNRAPSVAFNTPSVEPSLSFTATPPPSPSPTMTWTPLPSLTPTPTQTPTSTPTWTPTLIPTTTPTPFVRVAVEALTIYAGPGMVYEPWGEIHRGDMLPVIGRSADGMWLQVNFLGRAAWIDAYPSAAYINLDTLPVIEPPATPTPAPTPTVIIIMSTLPVIPRLQNAGFENIQPNNIPGWQWWANRDTDNLAVPAFKQADDPARMINGATLQIDGVGFTRFQVYIFQTINIPPATLVRFQASAGAFADQGDILVSIGIDSEGRNDCSLALWGNSIQINQSNGIVTLISPQVSAGLKGRITACLSAQSLYPVRSSAAFFDDAALVIE